MILLSPYAGAQEFGTITTEIRQQMDANKLSGLSVWNEINTEYIVHVEGLNEENQTELIQRFNNNNTILGFHIANLGEVIVTCLGGTQFDFVKPSFSGLVSNITEIETNHKLQ